MGFSNKDSHKHIVDYEADMYTGITTFHGLVRIYNSKTWTSRTFWIILSCAAMMGFMLQAIFLLKFYYRKPTQTEINFVAPTNGVEFPDITICNFNPVKSSRIRGSTVMKWSNLACTQVWNCLIAFSLLDKNEWGKCQKIWDPEENDTIWVEQGTYHASNCEANCIANVFMKRCDGCVPLRYQLNDTMEVCEPERLYHCINITEMNPGLMSLNPVGFQYDAGNLLAETETYWFDACTCGVECNRLEYNVEMSYSAIPSKAAINTLADKFQQTGTYVLENYLILNIYMKEITYEHHEQQKAITRTTVLSDVGGNMGMFLGMSVITLGEIFIFFVKGIIP